MTYIPFSVAATLAQKEFSWLKKLLDSHSYKNQHYHTHAPGNKGKTTIGETVLAVALHNKTYSRKYKLSGYENIYQCFAPPLTPTAQVVGHLPAHHGQN